MRYSQKLAWSRPERKVRALRARALERASSPQQSLYRRPEISETLNWSAFKAVYYFRKSSLTPKVTGRKGVPVKSLNCLAYCLATETACCVGDKRDLWPWRWCETDQDLVSVQQYRSESVKTNCLLLLFSLLEPSHFSVQY